MNKFLIAALVIVLIAIIALLPAVSPNIFGGGFTSLASNDSRAVSENEIEIPSKSCIDFNGQPLNGKVGILSDSSTQGAVVSSPNDNAKFIWIYYNGNLAGIIPNSPPAGFISTVLDNNINSVVLSSRKDIESKLTVKGVDCFIWDGKVEQVFE